MRRRFLECQSSCRNKDDYFFFGFLELRVIIGEVCGHLNSRFLGQCATLRLSTRGIIDGRVMVGHRGTGGRRSENEVWVYQPRTSGIRANWISYEQ